MRSKLGYLTRMSLKKKMGTKWFVIINILLAVALVGLINMDQIISFFGGNFNDQVNIVVIDKTEKSHDLFRENLELVRKTIDDKMEVEITKSDETEKEVEKTLKKDRKILIVFESDASDYLKAKVVTEGKIDTLDYQMITQALNSTKSQIALEESGIDPVVLSKISSPITIERILLDQDKKTEDENMSMIMGTVFPTVILPFFMLTIFLVQMLGTEINEEKTTRSMEIIISNVSPRTHFFSKILASNIFVISQGLLLILYAGLGLLVRSLTGHMSLSSDMLGQLGDVWSSLVSSGFVDKLAYVIPLTLILMLLSFLAYSLVAGILASMTVNMEDYQQIQAPIIVISLVGYYLAIMAGMFDGSLFIRILSYVPFLSCLVSPALLILGQVGIGDVLISIILLVIFNFVAIKYGMRIYKVGILNYSNEKIWNRFFKAVKTKDV